MYLKHDNVWNRMESVIFGIVYIYIHCALLPLNIKFLTYALVFIRVDCIFDYLFNITHNIYKRNMLARRVKTMYFVYAFIFPPANCCCLNSFNWSHDEMPSFILLILYGSLYNRSYTIKVAATSVNPEMRLHAYHAIQGGPWKKRNGILPTLWGCNNWHQRMW